jgi:hypothetical protein
MAAQAHKLGFGNGTLTDNGDGVRIADVAGFSVSKGRNMELKFRVLGHGTELASVMINRGASEKIEEWFRALPDFSRNTAPPPAPAPPHLDGRLIADELIKLAGLHDAGILSYDEFAAQKAKLLA